MLCYRSKDIQDSLTRVKEENGIADYFVVQHILTAPMQVAPSLLLL